MCSSTIEFAIQGQTVHKTTAAAEFQRETTELDEVAEAASRVSQEVVHFVVQYPLVPMNPARPTEPVVPFLAVPNSFIARGLDSKGEEKTHVFFTDSEESRDKWIKLLNTRSSRCVLCREFFSLYPQMPCS